MIISLVRHAKAGSRKAWTGPDSERPLDPKGRDQATAIGELLRTRNIGRIISSPALRCQQTVGPLVHLLGLPLELHGALAEGARAVDTMALLDECASARPSGARIDADTEPSEARRPGGTDVVLCSHGDVIPDTLTALSRRGVPLPPAPECRKGSVWDLHVIDGRIARAIYIPAP